MSAGKKQRRRENVEGRRTWCPSHLPKSHPAPIDKIDTWPTRIENEGRVCRSIAMASSMWIPCSRCWGVRLWDERGNIGARHWCERATEICFIHVQACICKYANAHKHKYLKRAPSKWAQVARYVLRWADIKVKKDALEFIYKSNLSNRSVIVPRSWW